MEGGWGRTPSSPTACAPQTGLRVAGSSESTDSDSIGVGGRRLCTSNKQVLPMALARGPLWGGGAARGSPGPCSNGTHFRGLRGGGSQSRGRLKQWTGRDRPGTSHGRSRRPGCSQTRWGLQPREGAHLAGTVASGEGHGH